MSNRAKPALSLIEGMALLQRNQGSIGVMGYVTSEWDELRPELIGWYAV
ncbi:MAG: hypothetical protein ACRENZ_00575 [Thermodesulfobacteriota bacterium]